MSNNRRILLIEDDELWRTNLVSVLASCGYSVESVTTWNSAIAQLKASSFHRIVSDLHVVSDARHGIEMLTRIGALNPPRTLVISKFVGSLKPKVMKQLSFIDYILEKSKVTETSDVWGKFLSYEGPQDISRLIVERPWFGVLPKSFSGRADVGRVDVHSVFVVHGRDKKVVSNFLTFLRSLGVHPIEWSQAEALTGVASPYIGDTIDAGMAKARAIVILLTGDDEARLKRTLQSTADPDFERTLTPQARPNVIFEAGYALAKYPKHAILVQVGRTRPFSDIAGRFVIQFDGSPTSRKHFVSRLETAEVLFDASGSDWLTSGDFGLDG